jgi:hypothetical protein
VVQEVWAGGGGMDVEIIGQSDTHLDFNVTRCGYAEFFRSLGLVELGARIHCSRDHAMVASFNDEIGLQRSQTIMQGGSCCDFRFRKQES